jgi:hypothetical protein
MLKTHAASFDNLVAVDAKLNAIAGAAGADTHVSAAAPSLLHVTPAKAAAIAQDLRAILGAIAPGNPAVAGAANMTNAFNAARVGSATALATDIAALATSINTGMGAGAPHLWNDPTLGKADLIDGNTGVINGGDVGVVGILNQILVKYGNFLTFLTSVDEDELKAAVAAVFGVALPASREEATEAIEANFMSQTNAFGKLVYDQLHGLFDVNPPAAAAGAQRTFVYQINQNALANDLNLTNNRTAASGIFSVIHPENMIAGDTTVFVFKGNAQRSKIVKNGDIYFADLNKDLTLHLRAEDLVQGPVSLSEIEDPLGPGTANHLTLQLSSNADSNYEHPHFKFEKEIKVKNLILGAEPGTKLPNVDGDKLTLDKDISGGRVNTQFDEDIYVDRKSVV